DGNLPEELIHDYGKEFENDEVKKYQNLLGIKDTTISIEDHQRNGRIDRVIRTIKECILKLDGENMIAKIDRA
ncbi:hypothetical protein COBT_003568, partial [Conglomerata obtusa]